MRPPEQAPQRLTRLSRVRMAVLLAKEEGAAVVADMVHPAGLVPVDGRAVVVGAPAVVGAADGSSSAARRFASSALRRSTASTTRTSGCSRVLSPDRKSTRLNSS